jgi:hypothetical protein
MEELVLMPIYVALWLSMLIYGKKDGKRSYTKINLFRTTFATAFGLMHIKPLLRILHLHEFAASWHYPDLLGWSLVLVNVISLVIFGIGEGHHDVGWNHRRGWAAAASAVVILAFSAALIYLGRPVPLTQL